MRAQPQCGSCRMPMPGPVPAPLCAQCPHLLRNTLLSGWGTAGGYGGHLCIAYGELRASGSTALTSAKAQLEQDKGILQE